MKSNLLKYCLLVSVFLGVPSKDFSVKNTESKAILSGDRFAGGGPKINPEIYEEPGGSPAIDLKEYDYSTYQNQYFQTVYFYNLADNIGINTQDSCGYVASAALLSFFDTYWDDNVIEMKYEQSEPLTTKLRYDGSGKSQGNYNSPGIIHEPWENGTSKLAHAATFEQYLSNIENYKDQYFHFLLLSQARPLKLRVPISEDDFDWNAYREEELYKGFNMYGDGPGKLLNWYLHDYRRYTTDQVEVESYNADLKIDNVRTFKDTYYRKIAIDNIKKGNPVIMGLYDYSWGKIYGHYVVAYDYDAATDRIFYNNLMQGQENTHGHVGCKRYSWDGIASVTVLKFKNDHSHTNNYTIDRKSYCSCKLCCPHDIKVQTSVDKPAKITWKSDFQDEKWFGNYTKYYYITVTQTTNLNPKYIEATYITTDYEYTLSQLESKVFAKYSKIYVMIGVSTVADIDLWKTNYDYTIVYRPEVNNSDYYYNYSNRYVKLTQGSKSGSTWTITVQNNTIFPLYLWYNKKMCFYNDGINWKNLSDIGNREIQPFSSAKIEVTTNWFADSIAVSHNFNACSATRYVTVCKNPSNGSLNNTYNAI